MSDEKKEMNSHVFIKHDDDTIIHEIEINKCKKSKYLMNYIEQTLVFTTINISNKDMSLTVFKFLLNYINYNQVESEPPEMPLCNIHIAVLFIDDEYDLFANICDIKLSLKDNLSYINTYMIAADIFQCKHLTKKLAAIAAFIILQDLAKQA